MAVRGSVDDLRGSAVVRTEADRQARARSQVEYAARRIRNGVALAAHVVRHHENVCCRDAVRTAYGHLPWRRGGRDVEHERASEKAESVVERCE